MASGTYHEPWSSCSGETREMHRAIVSVKEELEASTGTSNASRPVRIRS